MLLFLADRDIVYYRGLEQVYQFNHNGLRCTEMINHNPIMLLKSDNLSQM